MDTLLFILLLVFSCFNVDSVSGKRVRQIFLAAVEIDWDYAPYGRDLVYNNQREADKRILRGPNRIGSKYRKAVYMRYTDDTYTQLYERKPSWQGMLGPIIRGEVGDTLLIHFKNAATEQTYSVHPHGVFYAKDSEGALYLDGTAGHAKFDDGVQPGGKRTYIWNISETFAPTKDDDNCQPWAYHSHVKSAKDIATGLVGLLVVCKPGILDENERRTDVDQELVVYQDVTNENRNWYIDKSILTCGNPAQCKELLDASDPEFEDSNIMFHINGYSFGNIAFDVCEGENISIHFLSLNDGIHTAQIYGQTMIVRNHRVDTVALYPATFTSGLMRPINPGLWLLVCRNSEHNIEGMTAFFNVRSCPASRPIPTVYKRTRKYFIGAEEVEWNYQPLGTDNFQGGVTDHANDMGIDDHHSLHQSATDNTLGNVYKKVVFNEFTDETFRVRKSRLPQEQHLNLLGPPIKAEVGEQIEIVFFNNAARQYSIFLHGVGMEKEMEGAWYNKHPLRGNVIFGAYTLPGRRSVYRFTVPREVAPTNDDPNCLTYTYHSAVDIVKDINSGLVGPLLICKPGSLENNGKQMFVDREFFLFFQVIDENVSWYLDENIHLYVKNASAVDKGSEAFRHGNLMHSVNGRVFGNLQGLDMCQGDRVSWHVFGLGGSHDLHGIAFEGNSLRIDKQDLDTLVLAPGTSFTGYMYPDNPGTWAVFCHTFHHLMAGMSAQYTVKKCPMASKQVAQFSQSGIVRKYYIAAEEIDWNYAPTMQDLIENESLEDPKLRGYLYVRNDSGYIGPIYKKAVYREYTDETFSTQKQRIPEEEHLQLLGPFIRAEIGDVIEVVFLNKATHPFSIKPHGVFYDKSNEGMKYNDFSRDSETFDDAVPPGGTYTYRWTVPERSGPKPNETACIGWLYHSGSNMIRDTSSGLMGPLITCKKGTLDANGKRKDSIIREFAVAFYIINENRSWYIRQSYERFAQQVQPLPDNFEASNEMNAINGLIFGNLKGLDMNENDMVAWYILGLGSEDDFHTVHFHGHSYIHKTSRSHRGDVIEVFPGTYETVEMLADNAGTWLLHCHVTKHMMNGMEAVYTIHPKFSMPPMSLSNHLPGPENENMGKLPKIVSDHLSRLHHFGGNMASARIVPSKGSIQIRPVRVDHATNTRPFSQSHTHGGLVSKPSGLNPAFSKPEIRVIQSDATGLSNGK
ncbi:hypothetical protein ACJMK2_006822 [Sinanodonta woodiana]|uniref:Hephaestin-like protein 1 n=1 Tax=Sinanodonta woodiana TaxID=1069815 RepID=A0ABD3VUC3_SINWO